VEKRPLSRTSNAYESRLDRRVVYLSWYVPGRARLVFLTLLFSNLRTALLRGGRSVGLRRVGLRCVDLRFVYGLGSLYFAAVLLAVIAADVEPLVFHAVVDLLPSGEFPGLESAAIVDLVDQVGAFQFVDRCATLIGVTTHTPSVEPRVPTLDGSLQIGRGWLVGGEGKRGQEQNEKRYAARRE
jgi:hypothetical protein